MPAARPRSPRAGGASSTRENSSWLAHLPVADDHVSLTGDDRGDEPVDVAGVVLVVGVRRDDHVRAELQRRVEARLERNGEALALRKANDVVDAALACDLGRPVRRTVVHDEPLDRVEAGDGPREVGESAGRVASSFRHGIWMTSFTTVGPLLERP